MTITFSFLFLDYRIFSRCFIWFLLFRQIEAVIIVFEHTEAAYRELNWIACGRLSGGVLRLWQILDRRSEFSCNFGVTQHLNSVISLENGELRIEA